MMKLAEEVSLLLGEELNQLNLARHHLGGRYVDPMTRGGAAHLLAIAAIDRKRREYRESLRYALLAIETATE